MEESNSRGVTALEYENIDLMKFMERFRTEEQCRDFLFQIRWPEGFVCPKCEHHKYINIKTRHRYECSKCGYQASVMTNTIFHRSHTPLNKWFIAIFLLSADKRGLSSSQLAKNVSVSMPTAWLMIHKIRKAMTDSEAGLPLRKIVEMDDTYFGSPDEGGKRGRGTDKTPVLVAVQVDKSGRPEFVKMSVIENLRGDTIVSAAESVIAPGTEIHTDGLVSYSKLSDSGYEVCSRTFDPIGDPEHLLWVHKIISNAKAFIAGTFHGLDAKHLQRYLDEFAFRFNRRKHSSLFTELVHACVSTTTITYLALIAKLN
jgi:transposase-like protein